MTDKDAIIVASSLKDALFVRDSWGAWPPSDYNASPPFIEEQHYLRLYDEELDAQVGDVFLLDHRTRLWTIVEIIYDGSNRYARVTEVLEEYI